VNEIYNKLFKARAFYFKNSRKTTILKKTYFTLILLDFALVSRKKDCSGLLVGLAQMGSRVGLPQRDFRVGLPRMGFRFRLLDSGRLHRLKCA
jgi:hypothetical protein